MQMMVVSCICHCMKSIKMSGSRHAVECQQVRVLGNAYVISGARCVKKEVPVLCHMSGCLGVSES